MTRPYRCNLFCFFKTMAIKIKVDENNNDGESSAACFMRLQKTSKMTCLKKFFLSEPDMCYYHQKSTIDAIATIQISTNARRIVLVSFLIVPSWWALVACRTSALCVQRSLINSSLDANFFCFFKTMSVKIKVDENNNDDELSALCSMHLREMSKMSCLKKLLLSEPDPRHHHQNQMTNAILVTPISTSACRTLVVFSCCF